MNHLKLKETANSKKTCWERKTGIKRRNIPRVYKLFQKPSIWQNHITSVVKRERQTVNENKIDWKYSTSISIATKGNSVFASWAP